MKLRSEVYQGMSNFLTACCYYSFILFLSLKHALFISSLYQKHHWSIPPYHLGLFCVQSESQLNYLISVFVNICCNISPLYNQIPKCLVSSLLNAKMRLTLSEGVYSGRTQSLPVPFYSVFLVSFIYLFSGISLTVEWF